MNLLEEGIKKEVIEDFEEILSKVKQVFLQEISKNDEILEDGSKLTVEEHELYEDWIENVETIPLPVIESIETIPHRDGPHLKILYSLTTKNGKVIRKIKIKSSGKVSVYNQVIFDYENNGKLFKIVVEYDTYGNLTFFINKG